MPSIGPRGYATPLPQEPHLSFSFNLSSTAFVVYVFASIEELNLLYVPPPRAIDLYRTQQKNVRVVPFTNDLAALLPVTIRMLFTSAITRCTHHRNVSTA
jgi:hypothetical protein